MYQLSNIAFSVLGKDEVLEMPTNYLENVYRGCIAQSTLENSTNIMVLFHSFSYIEVSVTYGNYLAKCACSSTIHIKYIYLQLYFFF